MQKDIKGLCAQIANQDSRDQENTNAVNVQQRFGQ